MKSTPHRRTLRAALAALVLAGTAFAVATNASGATDPPASAKHTSERLVVRGEATVLDRPCDAGICIELADASFRGTPVGTGAYTGSIKVRLAEAFSNGEDGLCAPIQGDIVLGAGTANRLILAVAGDSCQDGGGNPETSSFTGLARFTVKRGTGAYAKAHGSGLATFSEDAADRERMTLVGRIAR
jgi:hypothetical protein